MTFYEQLIITIVDKLAIGGLILLAGFLYNMGLEEYKSRQAILSELAKQRVSKISEVWSAIYSWESIMTKIVIQSSELGLKYKNNLDKLKIETAKRIAPLDDAAKEKSEKVHDLVHENRFWLGENLYQRFREYNNNLVDYSNAFDDKNIQKMTELKDRREQLKQDVSNFLTKFK